MPLSKEIKDRIAKDADALAESGSALMAKIGAPIVQAQMYRGGVKDGYIAGAEAEAEKAAGLVDLLAKIRDHLPPKTLFVKEITEELIKYNNSK